MYQTFRVMVIDPLEFCFDQLEAQKRGGTRLYQDISKLIERQGNWLEILTSAPLLITEALHTIYGWPAIVLVDEYETPLSHALEHEYLSPASYFFERMFSLLLKVSEFL
jgi:hypothetical protein